MFCTRCNNDLHDCTCPDIDERLRNLGAVVIKWCLTCDKHYSRCHCEDPVFGVRTDGKNMPTTMKMP
jgi:hypothetical protein